MKRFMIAAMFCFSLVVGAAVQAATPVDPINPIAPADPSLVQSDSTIAPTTTLDPATPYATAPVVDSTDSRRAMEVIGLIIGLAAIVGIAAWAMRRRRTDVYRTTTTPNRVDDVVVPHHNVHTDIRNDRPIGVN